MHTLYTYGYQGGGVQPIQRIAGGGILIADIRFRAWSHFPGYRKASLERLLGLRYAYLPALGNASSNTGEPIQLRDEETGLRDLAARLANGPVCILCGCEDHRYCRRWVVGELSQRRLPGLSVVHLNREEIARRWPEE